MNHTFVGALIATLALSAGSYALTSAQPVHHHHSPVKSKFS